MISESDIRLHLTDKRNKIVAHSERRRIIEAIARHSYQLDASLACSPGVYGDLMCTAHPDLLMRVCFRLFERRQPVKQSAWVHVVTQARCCGSCTPTIARGLYVATVRASNHLVGQV